MSEEIKREDMPIILLIIDNPGYLGDNRHVLTRLDGEGLRINKDYFVFTVPEDAKQMTLYPILKLNEKNPWGLDSQISHGREGIESFLKDNKFRIR